MKKSILIVAVSLVIGSFSNSLFAQTQQRDTAQKATPTISAEKDTAATDISATIANTADHSMLYAAIKAANLEVYLKGSGPFTLLAPDNTAFSAIPKSRMDSLMADTAKLAVLVKAHIISGKFDKATLIKALVDGKGKTTLKTIGGQTLTVAVKNKKVEITDAEGNVAQVTSFDTPVTNGVVHGINGVLMYK